MLSGKACGGVNWSGWLLSLQMGGETIPMESVRWAAKDSSGNQQIPADTIMEQTGGGGTGWVVSLFH